VPFTSGFTLGGFPCLQNSKTGTFVGMSATTSTPICVIGFVTDTSGTHPVVSFTIFPASGRAWTGPFHQSTPTPSLALVPFSAPVPQPWSYLTGSVVPAASAALGGIVIDAGLLGLECSLPQIRPTTYRVRQALTAGGTLWFVYEAATLPWAADPLLFLGKLAITGIVGSAWYKIRPAVQQRLTSWIRKFSKE
jgi:hypothetical protein